MNMDLAVWVGQEGLSTMLWVASPLLITALVVGTLISMIQTITQVQEITLVFVPKMLAVFLVFAVAGGWMLQLLVGFGERMFLLIGEF